MMMMMMTSFTLSCTAKSLMPLGAARCILRLLLFSSGPGAAPGGRLGGWSVGSGQSEVQ